MNPDEDSVGGGEVCCWQRHQCGQWKRKSWAARMEQDQGVARVRLEMGAGVRPSMNVCVLLRNLKCRRRGTCGSDTGLWMCQVEGRTLSDHETREGSTERAGVQRC